MRGFAVLLCFLLLGTAVGRGSSGSATAILKGHDLAVPAHGRASILLTGLKNGRYALDIDGDAKGALIVGVAPGP